jgi:hypothetical protein
VDKDLFQEGLMDDLSVHEIRTVKIMGFRKVVLVVLTKGKSSLFRNAFSRMSQGIDLLGQGIDLTRI